MTKSKFFMFLTVLFFLSSVVFSQTITVTFPHSGSTLCKGRTYNITWDSTGVSASTNMKINIFKDSITQPNFVEQLLSTNDGTQSWSIASSYATGTYYIRIKTEDSTTHGDSVAFTIKLCATIGHVRIPRASMNLAELAVFMHGPGPKIKGFSLLRSILEKTNIKTPVIMQLYKGEKLFMDLGTFKPNIRGKQIFFKTIPNELKLKFTREQMIMLESVKGLELVLKTNGKVIGTKFIPCKLQTQ